eukprot:scaffold1669_cov129-Cylindrotheca_fusiformis.AAC.24
MGCLKCTNYLRCSISVVCTTPRICSYVKNVKAAVSTVCRSFALIPVNSLSIPPSLYISMRQWNVPWYLLSFSRNMVCAN